MRKLTFLLFLANQMQNQELQQGQTQGQVNYQRREIQRQQREIDRLRRQQETE